MHSQPGWNVPRNLVKYLRFYDPYRGKFCPISRGITPWHRWRPLNSVAVFCVDYFGTVKVRETEEELNRERASAAIDPLNRFLTRSGWRSIARREYFRGLLAHHFYRS